MGVCCQFIRIARIGIVSAKGTTEDKKNPTQIFHAPIEIRVTIRKSNQEFVSDIFTFTLNYVQKNPFSITCPHFEITQWARLVEFLEKHFSETEIENSLPKRKIHPKNELQQRIVEIKKIEYFKSSSYP